MDRIEKLKRVYRLEPHPGGGAFAEAYTSPRFRYVGFKHVGRESLARLCPDHAEALARLACPGEDRGA